MIELIKSIQSRDPAQPTFAEVMFAYPGVHALGFHWIAHKIWGIKLHALARFIAHLGRLFTGIEIHPGATIGKRLFIDHGMGVVIGETAIVGNDVTLYHGVTLGGKGGEAHGSKRHPSLEDNVMVGAGAQVLGAITVGKGAKIGASSLVTSNIPAGCTAIGNPARLVNCQNEKAAYGLPDSDEHLDPVGDTIGAMLKDIEALKEKAGLQDQPSEASENETDENYAALWKSSGI